MPRPSTATSNVEFAPLSLVAATWFACGAVLYGLTPLPLHNATLGWSPAFWLVAAPLLLLAARSMVMPRRMPVPEQRAPRSIRYANIQAIRRRKATPASGRPAQNRARRLAA